MLANDCEECDAPAIAAAAVYTGDLWRNTQRRPRDGQSLSRQSRPDARSGRRPGVRLEGVTLFGYALYNNGHVLSDALVGSAQGISNIESVHALRLYELWMQWHGGANPGSVRVGLYDLNSEFDAIDTASLFMNPSHGIGADFAQSGRTDLRSSRTPAWRYAQPGPSAHGRFVRRHSTACRAT